MFPTVLLFMLNVVATESSWKIFIAHMQILKQKVCQDQISLTEPFDAHLRKSINLLKL